MTEIYQITARDPEHDYRFMGLDYVEKKGITVTRADYDLIYAAPLTEKDTLDGIYERFNIQRPADFTGHSLSVSDVVVLNDGSTVKAYYVDSIGFAELPEFFKERNGGFVGMYELVVNDKVQRENINSINYFRDDQLVQQAISDMEKLMEARQKSKEQERSSTKKSVLDALRSLKTKKQEQPAQEQDKPKKAKKKGMEL